MRRLALVATLALLLAGCAQDPAKRVLADAPARGHVMDLIAADPAKAGEMTDRLLASDSLTAALLDRLMASPSRAALAGERVARDQEALDATLRAAVKDPATRAHLTGWMRGMEAGAAAPR